MKLKKGDTVIVTQGRDLGKKGKIEEVFPALGRVIVAGVNIYKKHMKKRDEKNPGGIIEKKVPMDVSKLALVCPSCGNPTRVGYLISKKEKQRICRKCEQKI